MGNRIVYGGGSSEISCAIAVSAYADTVDTIEQHAIRAYADALEDTPMALAEHGGLDGIEAVSKIRAAQLSTGNSFLGVDAMGSDTIDMKAQRVFETLIGKQQQIMLATQLCRMILKIDDVFGAAEYA